MNLPYGILWHMCAWCGAEMSAEVCPIKNDGEVSHGCCKPCYEKMASTLVVLLVPYSLMAFGMIKAVICG